jgi:hypothetical protein
MNNFKEFAKYLLLAQTASDAGKGYVSTKSNSAKNAVELDYDIKDMYIRQAIAKAKCLPNVKVGVSGDIGMVVILFDIKGYGQVSFHTFGNYSHLVGDVSVRWNGVRGGSIFTCIKIAKKYNLPWYKHS